MRDTDVEHNIREMLERDCRLVDKFDTEKGGIYIETNEDPRGWVLGDKTRKIYEVSNLKIKLLTDLLVIVTSNHDGSEIKVSVYNPRELGRMLLSKNDDVGSSIMYAKIDVSKPVELTAKMGEHVCIESLMKGSWIRLRIFPGANIVETLNNDKSEMLKLAASADPSMKERLQRLVNMYYATEEEIDVVLSGLRRHGESCDCDDPIIFKQIHEGEFDEIIWTCITCGGTVEYQNS